MGCVSVDTCPNHRLIAGDVRESIFYMADGRSRWGGWNHLNRTFLLPLLRRLRLDHLPVIQSSRLTVTAPTDGLAQRYWPKGEQPWHLDFLLSQGRVVLIFLTSCAESTHFVDGVSGYRAKLRDMFPRYAKRSPSKGELVAIVRQVFADEMIPMRDTPALWRECCEGRSSS